MLVNFGSTVTFILFINYRGSLRLVVFVDLSFIGPLHECSDLSAVQHAFLIVSHAFDSPHRKAQLETVELIFFEVADYHLVAGTQFYSAPISLALIVPLALV